MPFTPGQSGNRLGRPRGFAGLARKIRTETNDGDELVAFALRVLRDEDAEMRDRLAAHAWLTDRGYGRPIQAVELSADVTAGPALDPARVLARLPTSVIRALVEAASDAAAVGDPPQLDGPEEVAGDGPSPREE